MEAPSKDKIDQLKAKHPDRALHLVEFQNPGEEEITYFIMQGANYDEYKLYQDQIRTANDAKSDLERSEKLMTAAKNAVMRQTVWPDRDEVKDILFRNPGFVEQAQKSIREHCGSSAEVRSKKL
jgi:hypothetical protein